jgi:hypothetical protein
VGWSPEYQANWTPALYPRMHLLPDGRVVAAGSQRQTRIFDPVTNTWSTGPYTVYGATRPYGTSVLLPLKPGDGYKARVMILGGGNPATATTEILNLSAATLQWVNGPAMSQGRIEMNATILPNGKVLAMGGSLNDEDATTASYNADLYDPAANTFSSAGMSAYPRLYHSSSLLLPDGTVALLGGNPQRGSYGNRIEIYSPAYLFAASGSPAVRPVITGAPATFDYGTTFQVQTPDAANIGSVVLVRPGASTHAFDMEQRLVHLLFTKQSGVLAVTAPPNGNVAPPGYYMLFVLNASGVPSMATFVRARTDTVRPTAPGTLTASASGTQIALTWTAASDNVGVTRYRIERCQGAGCSTFTQIATATGLSYVNSGLPATTSYRYRVRATDAAGNAGPYSNVAAATTGGGGGGTPSGLVAAYGFNEGTGTTTADGSQNGHTGTIVNATWATAGKFGRALAFNGTSARVRVPNGAALQLTTRMTLEAWVKPSTVTSAWRDVIYKGNDNYYLEATSGSSGRPAAGGTFGGAIANLYGPAALAVNQWTHLAMTYDGATLRLYVNGVQVSNVARSGALATSKRALEIGGDSIYGHYFAGTIDEVRIYNRALTAGEIQSDLATPVTTVTGGNQAPTATITSPSGDVAVNPGRSAVTPEAAFTGTGR